MTQRDPVARFLNNVDKDEETLLHNDVLKAHLFSPKGVRAIDSIEPSKKLKRAYGQETLYSLRDSFLICSAFEIASSSRIVFLSKAGPQKV